MMTTATALMSSAAFIMWTMVRSTVFVNIYIYIYEIQKQKNKYTVSLFNVPKIFIVSYFYKHTNFLKNLQLLIK